MLAGDADGGKSVCVNRPEWSADLLHTSGEFLHKVVDRSVLTDEPGDFGRGVDDRGVVATAEFPADLGQRGVGELAREIHRDLARVDDVLRAPVAAELVHRQLEALGNELLD